MIVGGGISIFYLFITSDSLTISVFLSFFYVLGWFYLDVGNTNYFLLWLFIIFGDPIKSCGIFGEVKI